MDAREYENFDLLIERSGEGYRARVLNSPVGQASTEFELPFSPLELENFILRMGQQRGGMRRIESPQMEAAKVFGSRLFRSIFSDEVAGCLQGSLIESSRSNRGLRIRLRLSDAPELLDLPWEYLYNESLNRFLALSVDTPVVRYLELPGRIEPLEIAPPLRVLVMISNPTDFPDLDTEGEWNRLQEATRDLQARGLVHLERVGRATLGALQRKVRRGNFHVFHFIGHGGFDEQAQDGVLILEDEQRRGRAVSGQYLGMLLHDEKSLRLAILNACEGGRTSASDPFAGVGQSFLQQGIPAVIAMQFEVSDTAAIALAHEFYAAIADGYPVDAALAEARKAIFARSEVEWGTPVLYLRSPDGRIFDVDTLATPVAPVPTPTPVVEPEPEPIVEPALEPDLTPETRAGEGVPVQTIPPAAQPAAAPVPGPVPLPETGDRPAIPLWMIGGAVLGLLVVAGLIFNALQADPGITQVEATEQVTVEPTEEVIVEATEAVVVEPTEERVRLLSLDIPPALTVAPFARRESNGWLRALRIGKEGRTISLDGSDADWITLDSSIEQGLLRPLSAPVFDRNASDPGSVGCAARFPGGGGDDLAGQVAFAYDHENLYVAFWIDDDGFVTNPEPIGHWRGDAPQLLLDSNIQGDYTGERHSADEYQIDLLPGRDAPGDRPAAAIFDLVNSNSVRVFQEAFVAAAPTETGYFTEASIPWLAFGIADGDAVPTIGVAPSVSENDTPGTAVQECMISASPGRAWSNPTTWSTLFLLDP